MIFGSGLIALAVLVLWVYCILDVIATDEVVMRNLPKVLWLLVVIFLPTIGSLAWLLLGRPERAGFSPGGSSLGLKRPPRRTDPTLRHPSRFIAPDDDPRFLSELDRRAKRLRDWEEDLRRREQQLRDGLGDEDGPHDEGPVKG